MEIPPDVSVPLCIEQGSIYLYEFRAVLRDGTEYVGQRFFIVLNVNPKTDEILVLTTITKQIDKQERYIETVGEDADTLVRISPADFSRLSVESVINCNNTYELTLDLLVQKIENGGKIFYEKLPKTIIDAIVRGVLKSNLVSAGHKKLLI